MAKQDELRKKDRKWLLLVRGRHFTYSISLCVFFLVVIWILYDMISTFFFFFVDNEEAKPEKTSEYILPSSDFLFCYWKEERRIGFEIFKLQVACSWSFSVSDWAQHWEMNKHFENLSSVHLEYKGCVPGLHWCQDSACAALLCGSQRRRDWGTDRNLQPQSLLPPVVGAAHS